MEVRSLETEINIKVKTENMNKLFENEDGTGGDVTGDTEKGLHDTIKAGIVEFIKGDALIEEIIESEACFVEGYDDFEDYGDVTITVDGVEVVFKKGGEPSDVEPESEEEKPEEEGGDS